MLHIVILVAWYICNPRQQRLAWYYSSSSTAVVPLLWNAILLVYNTLWITQSPFTETATPPPIAPTHGYVCSWYLLLVYTMYFSNPTAVFMYRKYFVLPWFAHKEHNHGFPDFPVQQHSYFLFSTRYFYFLVVVKHSTLFIRYIPGILYRAYWNITILRTPGTYIRGI